MITDNELLYCWPSRSDMDINDKKIWFARLVIRMAQEVRPLVFDGSIDTWIAETTYGNYFVCKLPFNGLFRLETANGTVSEFSSQQYAIEIANDIHRAITLKNLVHGGAE